MASYCDIVCKGQKYPRVARTHYRPETGHLELRDRIAIYAHVMHACYAGKERVLPTPGDFCGDWITSDVVGPFKVRPGTLGW